MISIRTFVRDAGTRVPGLALIAGTALLTCSYDSANTGPGSIHREQPQPVSQAAPAVYAYTHVRSDGNRLAEGRGVLPSASPIDIELDGKPTWLLGAEFGEGSIWVVMLEDGAVRGFVVSGVTVVQAGIEPATLEAGAPPLLAVVGGIPMVLSAPVGDASPLTHPVPLGDGDRMAYVAMSGDLVVWEGEEMARLPLGAIPDARIVVDEGGRLLVLSRATTQYPHGVLGDALESSSISVVETRPTVRVISTISLPDDTVVEGLSPMWTDVDGDGTNEILVTLSNASQGARLAVFNDDGTTKAQGPAVGQGLRWRHQVAAGPFGPGGEYEVVDVLTPHIGGRVEFFGLDGDRLNLAGQADAYMSHVIGSRNLDMAAAGDFDGDGRLEVLLPTRTLTELAAVRRTADGAEEAWKVDVGGRLSTNLAVVETGDGRLAVGVGRADGVLRLWLP